MPRSPARTVRRSVALPRQLVEDALNAAPRDLRHNLNRLVAVSLQEFVARRKQAAFELAVARMASDPAIRSESAAISQEFSTAGLDGLTHD